LHVIKKSRSEQRWRHQLILPMVAELEAAGLSLNGIAGRFNKDGIRSRRGGIWTAKAISNLKAAAA